MVKKVFKKACLLYTSILEKDLRSIIFFPPLPQAGFRHFSADRIGHQQENHIDYGIKKPDRRSVAIIGFDQSLAVNEGGDHVR